MRSCVLLRRSATRRHVASCSACLRRLGCRSHRCGGGVGHVWMPADGCMQDSPFSPLPALVSLRLPECLSYSPRPFISLTHPPFLPYPAQRCSWALTARPSRCSRSCLRLTPRIGLQRSRHWQTPTLQACTTPPGEESRGAAEAEVKGRRSRGGDGRGQASTWKVAQGKW